MRLSQNVQKMVDANKRIDAVHGGLKSVDKSLGEWKSKAGEVLQGAIGKAKDVYENLYPEKYGGTANGHVGIKIGTIEDNNNLIIKANTQLAGHVSSLQQWNSAAGSVIGKAEEKCDQILKRVDKQGTDAKIFENAQTLKDKAQTLLKAARDAKQAVEMRVGEALQAVVNMDGDLKKDLRTVREKIKTEIWSKITEAGVLTLDQNVRDDLGELREKIGELKNKVYPPGGIVQSELDKLRVAKSQLDRTTGPQGTIKTTFQGMTQLFTQRIKDPLERRVGVVYTTIETLGKTFEVKDKETVIAKVFNKIKGTVVDIKGAEGTWRSNKYQNDGKGLLGIVSGVKHYAEKFDNSGNGETEFDKIVKGWITQIVPNEPVKAKVYEYGKAQLNPDALTLLNGGRNSDLDNRIATQIKIKLKQDVVEDNLKTVKDACYTFAQEVGKHIKDETKIKGLAKEIAKNVESHLYHARKFIGNRQPDSSKPDPKLIEAVQLTLTALCSTAWKAGNEVDWFVGKGLLNLSANVHDALETAKTLEKQLERATEKSGQDGTAQAVDSRLEAVGRDVSTED
ncbi:Extracellular matrix-binding ebh, putative [Babesia ovata]|uniref:Extracellular matrix-binding ebh, putative n=1 Tax=Babesia ovata TaxID=189622 RepID=A0A2H6KGK6_9APIC|nr:Extracellular matrix-binding ebh, putative [Babesia ovata]GBE62132.1 Extracellular matrix-binding ebh, putative [Babesia ovata]